MKKELSERLLCPRCYERVRVEAADERNGAVWTGSVSCSGCGSSYPVLEGIAYLAAIDQSWAPMIREFLARAEITQAVLEDGGFEKDREERASAEHETTRAVMERLLGASIERLEISEGDMVLEVGADTCDVSRHFAGLGAEVVAADVEHTHLSSAVPYSEDGSRYFSRVMCDAHRLPFGDGTFDLVFCRSTVHHLDSMHLALKEMARVTSPGGRLVLASEPVRSVLDSQEVELEALFDYAQGLNERKEPVYYLTVPLRAFCSDVEVEYFSPSWQERSLRVLRAARIDKDERFSDGERLGFKRSFKLALATAAVNVYGTRNRRNAGRPRRAGKEVCDVSRIIASEIQRAAPPLPEGQDPATYGLLLYKQELSRIYRAMLEKGRLPSRITMGRASRNVLRKGFREPERSGSHKPYRHTNKRANCYISNRSGASRVMMRVRGFPAGADPAGVKVSVNGIEACDLTLDGDGWTTISFEKPAEAAGDAVLELEIMNENMFVPDRLLGNGDRRELGFAIESIWQR